MHIASVAVFDILLINYPNLIILDMTNITEVFENSKAQIQDLGSQCHQLTQIFFHSTDDPDQMFFMQKQNLNLLTFS